MMGNSLTRTKRYEGAFANGPDGMGIGFNSRDGGGDPVGWTCVSPDPPTAVPQLSAGGKVIACNGKNWQIAMLCGCPAINQASHSSGKLQVRGKLTESQS
jgi:hypothetical protein